MEPLSIAASLIAVVTFGAKSCECIYESFSRILDAPQDLSQHLTSIQALRGTLQEIAELANRGLPVAVITPTFTARIQMCMHDLEVIDDLAHKFEAELCERKSRRVWARVRLALGDHRRILRTHLIRVETHHRTLSMELLLLNA